VLEANAREQNDEGKVGLYSCLLGQGQARRVMYMYTTHEAVEEAVV